jgi:hypothetical protein
MTDVKSIQYISVEELLQFKDIQLISVAYSSTQLYFCAHGKPEKPGSPIGEEREHRLVGSISSREK